MDEGPKANPRRVAMENYGARLDVHDLLSRFMTDLLCAQPDGFFSYLGNLMFYKCQFDKLYTLQITFC
jgi:hypothetical protein